MKRTHRKKLNLSIETVASLQGVTGGVLVGGSVFGSMMYSCFEDHCDSINCITRVMNGCAPTNNAPCKY